MSSSEQLLVPDDLLPALTEESAISNTSWLKSRRALTAFWLLTVVTSVWIAGVLLRWATVEFDFSEPKLAESLAFHNQQFDIIYFGDSLTLEGVNASVVDHTLGTRSYNFALGGSSILESEIQLRNFLAQNPKPRMVALGVYVNQETRPAGVRPSLYFALSHDVKKLYERKMKMFEGKTVDRSFVVFNSVPAYRYRNSIDLVLKSVLSAQPQRPVFVQGQAQVLFSRSVHLGRVHDSVLNLNELQSFVTYCREQNLPLLIFEPPNHPGFAELTRNRTALIESIRHLVASSPEARFVSYEESGGSYKPDEWVNLNHLNLAGSQTFSYVLSKNLSTVLTFGFVQERR